MLLLLGLLSVSSPDQVLPPSLPWTATAEGSGAGCMGDADFESNKKHDQKAANTDG